MPKRLAVFLDGTWNDPADNTNVWRLKISVASSGADDARQHAYYDAGVGTRWYDRFRGGAFGSGLSGDVCSAYQWLMENFEGRDDDAAGSDEIYIFGFSRGAFAARSLAGMIARCGLLRPTSPLTVKQVFKRYKEPQSVLPLYKLEYQARHGQDAGFSTQDRWLLRHSRRVPIKFIGVWDTVGALGVPGFTRSRHRFHNTHLSSIYEHAYQALALDEHRRPYRPTLWTKFVPTVQDPDHGPSASTEHVEQRWFVGAHSNVGGGYEDNPLAQVPMQWLAKKASEAGLAFRWPVDTMLEGDEHLGEVVDSYKRFLKGTYRVIKRRFHRPLGLPAQEVRGGTSETVNETIDRTVFDRWQRNAGYRPENLQDWAERSGQDCATLRGTVTARA